MVRSSNDEDGGDSDKGDDGDDEGDDEDDDGKLPNREHDSKVDGEKTRDAILVENSHRCQTK